MIVCNASGTYAGMEQLLDKIFCIVHRYIDVNSIRHAKYRISQVLAGNAVDYLPMAVISKQVPEIKALPDFNWSQQWHDPAKSLYMQLKNNILPALAGGGDFVPAVRADTGAINCASVFGVKYTVPEHTKPVVTEYLPYERIMQFEMPKDISSLGVLPKMLEHVEYHKQALMKSGLSEHILIGHCDLQGPFDIAAMVRGHDIFTDFYEAPDFVHHIMKICTKVFVTVAKLHSNLICSKTQFGISDGIYMENGFGRICADTDILVSPQLHEDFIFPYLQEALNALGGGWLHYCGGLPGYNRPEGLHLHSIFMKLKMLRALNWTTAKDWTREMKLLHDCNMPYIGYVARADGQSLYEYFRMVLSPYTARKGFVFVWPKLEQYEMDYAMDVWYKIQDEIFN
ncbi:MAG: uroporphyrinogen decarboxylase family protein [Sedimentisphaerales bacterium]